MEAEKNKDYKFHKEIELERKIVDGKTIVTRLIQDEVFYSPEESLKLSKARKYTKYQKKTLHKEDPEFTPEKFTKKFKDQIKLTDITKKLKTNIKHIQYTLPEKLVNEVTKAIKTIYFNNYNSSDKRKRRLYETRLAQALYFCIAIYHFNYKKNVEIKKLKSIAKRKNIEIQLDKLSEIRYKYDVTLGCELSKNILTKIVSNKALYEIKNILSNFNIIGNIPLLHNYTVKGELNEIEIQTPELRNISFYAKNLNEALRYFINPKFLDYTNEVSIWNNYADKHTYFLENKILFGNKIDSLRTDYQPFKNELKNEQYQINKKISFIIPKLKVEFIKRFPNLINVINWWQKFKNIKYKKNNFEIDKIILKNKLGNNDYKNCARLFSICIDYHNHIFKATEKYRTYFYAFSYYT